MDGSHLAFPPKFELRPICQMNLQISRSTVAYLEHPLDTRLA